jgi:hypothetical protein
MGDGHSYFIHFIHCHEPFFTLLVILPLAVLIVGSAYFLQPGAIGGLFLSANFNVILWSTISEQIWVWWIDKSRRVNVPLRELILASNTASNIILWSTISEQIWAWIDQSRRGNMAVQTQGKVGIQYCSNRILQWNFMCRSVR